MINARDIVPVDGPPADGPRCPKCGVALLQHRLIKPNGSAPLGWRHPPTTCDLAGEWRDILDWCDFGVERRTASTIRG